SHKHEIAVPRGGSAWLLLLVGEPRNQPAILLCHHRDGLSSQHPFQSFVLGAAHLDHIRERDYLEYSLTPCLIASTYPPSSGGNVVTPIHPSPPTSKTANAGCICPRSEEHTSELQS